MDEPIKILFVDDEKSVLRAMERIFFDYDYEILTAESGQDGLDILLQNEPVQLVISDYRMPIMNGVDFLKEVCKKWPDSIRMVLSGYADIDAVISAINEGQIYKFVVKPWNNDELRITVSNAIERYFLHRENLKLTAELKVKNKELKKLSDTLQLLVAEKHNEISLHYQEVNKVLNIVDSLPVGALIIDYNGAINYCNRKGAKILDKEEKDIFGSLKDDLLPEDVCRFIQDLMQQEAKPRYMSVINNRKVEVKGTNMKDPDGTDRVLLVIDWEVDGA